VYKEPKQLILIKLETVCTCPQECDCENPPSDGLDLNKDSYALGISNHCPIHNWNPDPYPDCPTH